MMLAGDPSSAEDRSLPPLLPPLRLDGQQQHGNSQAEGSHPVVLLLQQGATADSSGPPLSEQPPPRGNESLQIFCYPESARAVLAEAAELRLLLNFDQWQCSSLP